MTEIRNFDFLLTQNEAGRHVAVVDGEEFTPYLVVSGKRYAVDDLLALIPANDAALDWADANARWFDISTAPRDGTLIELLVVDSDFPLDDDDENGTVTLGYWADASERSDEPAWDFAGWNHSHDCWTAGNGTPTHWRPIQNPPLGQLPEPLERLGEVLRKVKGA